MVCVATCALPSKASVRDHRSLWVAHSRPVHRRPEATRTASFFARTSTRKGTQEEPLNIGRRSFSGSILGGKNSSPALNRNGSEKHEAGGERSVSCGNQAQWVPGVL